MSGYVNYNVGMQPEVGKWMVGLVDEWRDGGVDEWIMDKDRRTGDMESFASPWRRTLEGWGSPCEASTCNHWQTPHRHQVFICWGVTNINLLYK